MKKIIKKIKSWMNPGIIYVCEKCGWQTQKTETTDKIKECCKRCNCN